MALVGLEIINREVGQSIEERLRELTDRFSGKVEPGKWNWYKETFEILALQIKNEGKDAHWRLGGLTKTYPYIFDKLAEAKGNERLAKYIALHDKLAGIGWKLSNDGKDKTKWEMYKLALLENWNAQKIDELFSLAGVSVTPTILPKKEEKEIPSKQEMTIFGIPMTNVLIGAGAILAGFWIYDRFIRRRE